MQILVFGMHRSGTSMVARLLNMMGAYFAPEGVSTGANEENPKGFWERRDVRTLNDQLLHSAKADWHRLGDFSLEAIPELTLALFRQEAAKIILSLDGHRPWFLKEPRLCVLAPLWLELLEFPVCVFVHRPPVEVAASLKTRDDFPADFSCALWEFYNTAALNATLGQRRVQISHRDLIGDPVGTVRHLYQALEGVGVRGLRLPSDEEVLAFVDPSLVRSKAKSDEGVLTPAQRTLCDAFETGAALRLAGPVHCSEEARDLMRAHDRAVDPENKIGSLEAEKARLGAELQTSQTALSDMRAALNEKRERLMAAERKLREAEVELRTSRKLGEIFRREMTLLTRGLGRQIQRLGAAAQADAIDAKVKEIQNITMAHQEAREQVQELHRLLQQAAAEIDRIRQSSRWKVGSFLLLRNRKYGKREAFEQYLGAFEGWLAEKQKGWAATRASLAQESVGKSVPQLPDLQLRHFDHESIDRITRQLRAPISVVVPIFNGASDLERCVESVLRYTAAPFELILVDDCSSEAAVGALLAKYETHESIRVLRQQENRGFVRSANAGMQASTHDVVLLNSDTEVTPRWRQQMTAAAYSDPRIATVTPFSNAAGAFSVPQVGVNAPIPFPFTPLKMSRLTERVSSRVYPEVPTGNGFCLFIKRQVLAEIGGFDEENFGRGYAEENDFCMRARQAGWRHVIDDSLFVYHRGNSAFGEEKEALLKRNRETLDRLHPDYTGLVDQFTSSPEINTLRARIGENLQEPSTDLHLGKARILYILHEGTGGVPMTNADLVSKVSATQQCFLLTSTGTELILREWRDDRVVERKRWKVPGPWSAENFNQPAMAEVYFEVLVGLGIDLVHIRHLFKHSFDAPQLCRALGIPVVLSFHDYYFVCPSIHLLDQNAKYCGGQCTPGLAQCTIPSRMLENLPMLKGFLPQWRERVSQLFDHCDAFLTTAESVREVHLSAFPQLREKPFWVVEHGRDLKQTTGVAVAPRPGEAIRILAAGNIDRHKGSGFMRHLVELDSEGLIEFHFLGRTDETLRDIGVHHGPYDRDDFEKLVREIRPSFAGIFSTWPETYSHTLTEAWSVGLPVLGSKLGAVRERIARHGGGWLVDPEDPAGTLAQIREIAQGNGAYEKAIREVEQIQFQSVTGMAEAYLALYELFLSPPVSANAPRVGCLLPPGDRGSTFVRVTLPLRHERMQERLFAARLPVADARDSLGEWIDRLQLRTVLLQREAVDMETAVAVVETCRARNLRLVFEMDDNLLALADSHIDYAFYQSRIESIRYLAEKADCVVVSTPNLLEIFRPLNVRTYLIGNALDEWVWFQPLRPPENLPRAGTIVAGYMGTRTHGADLETIREPFLRARHRLEREHDLRLELQIIGGCDDDPAVPAWYHRVDVPRGCTTYPRFVRWLRETVAWDFALAPLRDDSLNASKSALKFFEYAGLGLPGIFTRLGEYTEVIHDKESGFLIDPEAIEDWEDAIVEMAVSPDLRARLARGARQQIEERHLLGDKVALLFSALNPAEA